MKKPKMITIPSVLVFVGAVASAVGAWLLTREQSIDSGKNQAEIIGLQKKVIEMTTKQESEQRALRIKSEEIAELNKLMADAQKELNKKSEELLKITVKQVDEQKMLRAKSEEISLLNQQIVQIQGELYKKSEETIQFLISAGSYPSVSISYIDENTLGAIVLLNGKYPLKDLSINIMTSEDMDKFSNDFSGNYNRSEVYKKRGYTEQISALIVGMAKRLNTVTYKWRSYNKFSITMMAQNGTWHQEIEGVLDQNKTFIMRSKVIEGMFQTGRVLEQEGNWDVPLPQELN